MRHEFFSVVQLCEPKLREEKTRDEKTRDEKTSERKTTGSRAAALVLLSAGIANAMTAMVTSSIASPAPVGTKVSFSATADTTGNLWYRFRVRRQGGDYQIIRDFGPVNTLEWTATTHEGAYDFEVTTRNLDTGDVAVADMLFRFQSIVTGTDPIISPTTNSLVFLYSAPPCASGGRMRVEFMPPGGVMQYTPFQNCQSHLSMNFYLAGLLPDTIYTAYNIVDTGAAINASPVVAFTTGDLPANLYSDTILKPSFKQTDTILLGSSLGYRPMANDLAGNVLWYGPDDISILTRPERGGNMWGIVEISGADPSRQIIRKFDLTGMTVLETNAARVNEQLATMGKRQIDAFHHEVRTLADGNIAVLGDVEQILSDVQGPGPVDILGDMIVVLDNQLKVVWTWDTFDNLDVHRAAVLGEQCPASGCPPTQLSQNANDWTHGNAIQETADGNLLYSSRHQDWLIKISYDGANGDGHVIYRLGKDGDFQINSSDPYPWFSHQHDGNFENADATKLVVFDDGNTRVAAMGSGNSRGQVLRIDEQNRVANPLLNADLGVYSVAVGSAQALRDGNYHFDAGFVPENNTTDAYSFEVNPAGKIVYNAHQNAILYRTFRMTDMYTPN